MEKLKMTFSGDKVYLKDLQNGIYISMGFDVWKKYFKGIESNKEIAQFDKK